MRCQLKGFTLIELLVALSIMCILIVIAVPNFSNIIHKHRISATADSLYSYLQFARSEAVKQNTNIYVSFQTGDTWCYGINAGSICNCTIAGNCGLATVSYGKAQQVSLSVNGLSSNAIYFEGSHSAANTSGSVSFSQYGQTSPLITINIGRLGNMQVCSTGISGYSSC